MNPELSPGDAPHGAAPDGASRVARMRRPGVRAPDLSEVHAFVAAARTGSLAKAAAELHISTPAVAKRVRNLEASAGTVLIADDDRRFTDANAAAVDVLGYSRDELLRLRIDDLLAPDDREQVEDAWRAFRALGTVRAPGVLRCADGSYRAGDIHSRADFTPGRHLTVWRMAPL